MVMNDSDNEKPLVVSDDYNNASQGGGRGRRGREEEEEGKSSSPSSSSSSSCCCNKNLVVCTRIHLGKATNKEPPCKSKLQTLVYNFLNNACIYRNVKGAAIAVDGDDDKIPGYSLSSVIKDICKQWKEEDEDEDEDEEEEEEGENQRRQGQKQHQQQQQQQQQAKKAVEYTDELKMDDNVVTKTNTTNTTRVGNRDLDVEVIVVCPWGEFTPALNALVSWSIKKQNASLILFVSAETNLSVQCISKLCSYMNLQTTLVAGAVLSGHDYRGFGLCKEEEEDDDDDDDDNKNKKGGEERSSGGVRVELNGRTSPWNTAAVWNAAKLALIGFPLVAEGLHRDNKDTNDGSLIAAGVEEVSTIAIIQNLLSKEKAQAKLIYIPEEVQWNVNSFIKNDEKRKQWHEHKMKSKIQRPAKHLEMLGLQQNKGLVLHY